MRLTKETEHALKALSYLAAQPPSTILEAGALGEAIAVPRAFMSKIMQRLAKAQIVRGHRGNPRGYSLAMSPARLTVRRILETLEGDDIFQRCIFWSEECSEVNSCPLHETWKSVRPMVRKMMSELTVADLAARK